MFIGKMCVFSYVQKKCHLSLDKRRLWEKVKFLKNMETVDVVLFFFLTETTTTVVFIEDFAGEIKKLGNLERFLIFQFHVFHVVFDPFFCFSLFFSFF